VVGTGQRIVEDHHNAIANKPLERPAKATNLLPEAGVVFAEHHRCRT